LFDSSNKPVNQKAKQQEKIKPQKQKADLDERGHMYVWLGISHVYFSDL
jgi:hypothetical protein